MSPSTCAAPTFGRWVRMTLSAENMRLLWVPPGFAHSSLVVSDVAEFLYKTTDYYVPQLSAKDAAAPRLREAQTY